MKSITQTLRNNTLQMRSLLLLLSRIGSIGATYLRKHTPAEQIPNGLLQYVRMTKLSRFSQFSETYTCTYTHLQCRVLNTRCGEELRG